MSILMPWSDAHAPERLPCLRRTDQRLPPVKQSKFLASLIASEGGISKV